MCANTTPLLGQQKIINHIGPSLASFFFFFVIFVKAGLTTMYERPEGIENCRIWIDGCFDFAHHGMFFVFVVVMKT